MIYTEKPILAIGNVNDMFIGHFEFKDDLPKTKLKAAVVQIGKGPVSLLLHACVGKDRHELSGILRYMEEKNLDFIRVNGGTSLTIDFTKDKENALARDPFEILGPVSEKEFERLWNDNFPEIPLKTLKERGQTLKRAEDSNMLHDGIDYTKDDIINLMKS